MAISNNNTRTLITISKDLKSKLEKIAESENRTFSNLVATILKKYVEENSEKIDKEL